MNKELISIFDAIRNAFHKIINSTNFGFLVKTFLAVYGIIAVIVTPVMLFIFLISIIAGFMGEVREPEMPLPMERSHNFENAVLFSFLPQPFGKTVTNRAVLGTDVAIDYEAPSDEGALPDPEDYMEFYNEDPAEYYNPENYIPAPIPVPPGDRVISPNPGPGDFRAPTPYPTDPFEYIKDNPVFLFALVFFLPVVVVVISYMGSVTYLAAKSVQTGNEVRVTHLLRNAKKYIWNYFLLMLFLQLLFMLVGLPTLIFVTIGVLTGEAGTVLMVFLGILYAFCSLSFVGIKTMFAIYELFHEDKNAVDAIKTSFELTKGYLPIFFFIGNQYILGGAGGFLIGMFTILVMYEIYLDLKRIKGEVATVAPSEPAEEQKE
jgi:hypothetical protein